MKTMPAKIFSSVLFGALLLPLLTLVACNSATNAGTNQQKYPFLVAFNVQPNSAPSIAVGNTVQLGANAEYQISVTDFANKDVTNSASWSTSNPDVATVNKGLVTGTGIGSATISASLDGKTGSTLVVVGQTGVLDITPTDPFSLSATPEIDFYATETFPDGSTLDVSGPATWTASPGGIVDIYPYLGGHAKLVATGTTTITATLDTGETGAVTITVVP